jgi:hypothetical protein
MRTPLILAASFTVSAAVRADMATFSILLSTNGPVAHGAIVAGTLRCTWSQPDGYGYGGGSFRLRMDGLGIDDVLFPNNSSDGINSEDPTDRIGVPASELPPGAGTLADRWTSGRRPMRTYLLDATDPTSIARGGFGFRLPPLGSRRTDVHFSVEQQSGVTYLTGRNGAGVENQIDHAQIPRSLQADPLFFEPSYGFDVFKFQVRAPRSGSGTATITPEIGIAFIFSTSAGAQHSLLPSQIHVIPASFTYTPAPASVFTLLLATSAFPQRRRPKSP